MNSSFMCSNYLWCWIKWNQKSSWEIKVLSVTCSYSSLHGNCSNSERNAKNSILLLFKRFFPSASLSLELPWNFFALLFHLKLVFDLRKHNVNRFESAIMFEYFVSFYFRSKLTPHRCEQFKRCSSAGEESKVFRSLSISLANNLFISSWNFV